MKYLIYVIAVWLLSMWACTPASDSQDTILDRDNNLEKFKDYDWSQEQEVIGFLKGFSNRLILPVI